MRKSTHDLVAAPSSRPISKVDVGKRVLVNGHFGGVLKYVGKILDKEGMFCGIELDQPLGKNDGSHKGVSYFESKPGHGIFAPGYKVALESSAEAQSAVIAAKANVCTKSSIASFQPHPASTTSQVGTTPNRQSTMEWSLMSTTSSYMENSLISSNQSTPRKYANIDDLMMNSNTTYVVTDSDCMMLCDIEIPDSSPLSLEDDDSTTGRTDNTDANRNARNLLETGQAGSVVLDRCTLDPSLLPTVDDSEDDELQTPMIEILPKAGLEMPVLENLLNNNNLGGEIVVNVVKVQLDKSLGDSESGTRKREAAADNPRAASGVKQSETGGKSDTPTANNLTTTKLGTGPTTATAPVSREKKPRISVMEQASVQNQKPAIQREPKKPSKSQQVMEMIAASIAAEKQRAKMEAKPKVATVTAPLTPIPNGADTNESQQRLKTRSGATSVRRTTPSSSRENMATENGASKMPKDGADGRNSRSSRGDSTKAARTSMMDHVPSVKLPPKTSIANATPASRSGARLSKTTKVHPTAAAEEKNRAEMEELRAKVAEDLRIADEKHSQLRREKDEELERLKLAHNQELESLQQEHREALEKLPLRIVSLKSENEAKLQSEMTRLTSELTNSHQRDKLGLVEKHSAAVENLESLLRESKKHADVLEKGKRELEEVFKKSESEKIKKLAADLDSVKYELECKMDELKRLRAENANLKFITDALQQKDLEIQKLTHRLKDLGVDLANKLDIEKALNLQLEELRREVKSKLATMEELSKENDTLSYRLSEMGTSLNDSCCDPSVLTTPSHIARQQSTGRPGSSQFPSPANNSTREDGSMAKSLDSTNLSLYQQHGRHRTLNTPTKIYAPEGTYEVGEAVGDTRQQCGATPANG